MNSHDLHKKLEKALRAERPLRRVSPDFSERVLDALPARPQPRPAQNSRSPRFALAITLAAGLATIALLAFLRPAPPVHLGQLAPTETPAPGFHFRIPSVTSDQVQALTAKIDEPLELEFQRVVSDTKNAIRFVASNFLPETPEN